MKKILTLISIMMFAFVLIGCGGSKPENPEDPGTQPEDPGTQPEEPSETPEEGLDSIDKVIELFKIDEVAKIEIQANDAITFPTLLTASNTDDSITLATCIGISGYQSITLSDKESIVLDN